MKSSTQKPLSALNITTLAPTQVNFPALQHFFPMDEAVGSTTITDSINSVVITPDSALTVDGTKATVLTTTADLALTSGTWVAPGDKEILLCVMGTYTAAGTYEFTLGAAGSGVRQRLTETILVFNDATTALTDAVNVLGDGTDSLAYIGLDKGEAAAGLIKGEALAAAYTALTSAGNGTLQTTMAAPASNVSIDGFTNVYGIAIFHFDLLPTDLEPALLWMRNEWAAGNKTIYPGWKNKS